MTDPVTTARLLIRAGAPVTDKARTLDRVAGHVRRSSGQ